MLGPCPHAERGAKRCRHAERRGLSRTRDRPAIDERCKVGVAAVARPSDFVTHETGSMELSLVLDPTLSLYCIDPARRSALFVRTPPELDLSSAPFLWHPVHRGYRGRVVPFGELHDLAAKAPVPSERLVLVQSTGRCGSTLVSHALAAGEGVVSLSEPDWWWCRRRCRSRARASPRR